MWNSDGFFDVIVSLNKLCNKQSSCWWFALSWCFCDVTVIGNDFWHKHGKEKSRKFLSSQFSWWYTKLTHRGQVTHICISKINWSAPNHYLNQCWVMLIEPLGTSFNETLIKIQNFSFKKMLLKMLSVKWQPFCLGLNISKEFLEYISPFWPHLDFTALALSHNFLLKQSYISYIEVSREWLAGTFVPHPLVFMGSACTLVLLQ